MAHRLQSGEVLVRGVDDAIHRAGALVTDFGGALTHTAVVGTHCATATLVDGDGTLGTVTRLSQAHS